MSATISNDAPPSPMLTPKKIQRIGDGERRYVNEVLDNGFAGRSSSGMVNRFESAFAEKFGVRCAVAHVNGTATLHSCLAAAGVGPGDEVIVPPLTMSATSLAVLHAGATPVFADVDAHTFNIDPACIERCVSLRTRAIMPVALYGLSPDMDAILRIAERHRLCVIEDAAQCFLGTYKGRLVGTMGHLGSYSFQSSKHMTCGEGGVVVTNDAHLAGRVRQFSSLGYSTATTGGGARLVPSTCRQNPDFDRHTALGWNYRMSDLCAAVALGQIEHLEELVEVRQRVAQLYQQVISDCDWIRPQWVPKDCVSAYWTLALRVDADHRDLSQQSLVRKFQDLGGDPVYAAWKLTYLEPLFRQLHDRARHDDLMYRPACGAEEDRPATRQRFAPGLCPVAERIQPRLLQLKTNYFDLDEASRQADVLGKTIAYFN